MKIEACLNGQHVVPVTLAYRTIIGYPTSDDVKAIIAIVLYKEKQLSKAHDTTETLEYCL